MALCRMFTKLPCRSLGPLVLVYLSCWISEHTYGMALAISNNTENLIQSSGLITEEESIFRNIIDGIASNAEKPWYQSAYAPKAHSSNKNAVDLKEVLKTFYLANSGMEVVKTVEERLKAIDKKMRDSLGIWSIQVPRKITPFKISTNNRNLVLEIENHDCLKNKEATLPSNSTTDSPGSTWIGRSDSVHIPFECPVQYDSSLYEKLKNLRNPKPHHKSKRSVEGDDTSVNIIQVNITITNEVFDKTLLNILSSRYIRLAQNLTNEINEIFNDTTSYKGVNDFSFRSGSVIATFHIEIGGNADVVRDTLGNATVSGSLGTFTIEKNLTQVKHFVHVEAAYSSWSAWTSCSKSCGEGQQERRRSCNSSAPLACAHYGPSVESEPCYQQYCSQDCRQNFTGEKGNFSSPVVGGKYPALAECVWQIQVDNNHTIVAYFTEFEIEPDKKCLYDYVAIYDKAISDPASSSDREEVRFCGETIPPKTIVHGNVDPSRYPINSTDSTMTIYFKTDENTQYKGFTIVWHKVLKAEYRVSSLIPQSVVTLSMILNPWSNTKNAVIPLGKATTCPDSLGNKDCYFLGKQTVISRIIALFLNKELPFDSQPITITFEHILDEDIFPSAYTGRKTCVTWDHTIPTPRFGAWTRRGCYSSATNLTHTKCKCDHTGIFAVLGQNEVPPKDLDLMANSYFAVAVSLLFAILTVTALARRESLSTGELFHLFETLVLGLILVIFLIGAHIPAEKMLCGFLAFFLYYLVLSQFTWMLLTGIWIQNLLKRFLAEKVKIKILYLILGWLIPLILAGVAGKVDIDHRGNEDNVCWVSMVGAGTVWGYGAPVFAMLMVNVAIFIFLLLPSAREKYDHQSMRRRLVKEMFTMFFFLMAWVMGVSLILDDSFTNQYLFCIFLILQGVVNYNFCFEKREQFWIEQQENSEDEPKTEENNEKSGKDDLEEKQSVGVEEKFDEPPRMTVKTLKNLNIYKENGVFVIEA